MPGRPVAVLIAGVLVGALPAAAQEVAPAPPSPAAPSAPAPAADNPDTEGGRYSFHPIEGGVLRLDLRSGAVAHCGRRATGWACVAAAEDREALEAEIARLQRDNALLKQALLAQDRPLPGAPSAAAPRPRSGHGLDRADPDRMLNYLDRAWQRLKQLLGAVGAAWSSARWLQD